MKSILIIGLGRFGRHMAAKFIEEGNSVLAIEKNAERADNAINIIDNIEIGDATNEIFMQSLGIKNFDICVVAIGDNFQSALEITVLLKDNGAKFILARASRDVHRKLLLRNGADQVVYPEKEMAIRAAVKYSSDNVFDYIELTGDYSIYEVPVPRPWIGKSLIQLSVRTKYHISVMALRRGTQLDPLPRPDHVFQEDETMLILGANKDLNKFIQHK